MNICWHGTNEENARSIMKTGFKPWTHFAAHLEDAIAMGGPYVFAVRFRKPAPHWQFLNKRRIPPSQIRSLTEFWSETLYGEPEYKSEVEPDDGRATEAA